ncbi:MAG: NINE protein [Clostridia bacterium]|nr:NINE protein [Clostridia bacterium]
MKFKEKKKCPRCGKKVLSEIGVCPQCKLNFQKFDSATNLEGKSALKQGEKDRIIYRLGVPSDVNRWKLLLLTVFLGFAGAHHYYVGRKNMGFFYSIFFGVGIIYTILTLALNFDWTSEIGQFFYLLVLTWGFVILLWIVDIAKVCFNRFKIPVSLPRR